MNIVKRAVKIFGIAAMVMLISAVSVMAATSSDVEKPTLLNNGSFEDPDIKTKYSANPYKQIPASDVPYWRTTAVRTTGGYNQIELLRQNNGTYISGIWLTPKVGLQAAELNAEEASTMYQYLYAPAGSVYEWGISHRARTEERTDTTTGEKYRDIMAVFIGPKQPVDPAKESTTDYNTTDQFTKTVDWLKDKGHLDTSGLQDGDCKAFEVFTTKFAANGKFEVFDDYNDAISLTQTATHTEKWHVWIITSSKGNWYDYGVNAAEDCAVYGGGQNGYSTYSITNTSYTSNNTMDIKYKKPDYDYQYTVPASSGSDEAVTMYALCAYETGNSQTGEKRLTYGNFIDDVKLSLKVPVRVTSTEGGSTAVEIPGSTGTVTNTQQFKGTTDAGNMIKLTITPGARGDDEEGNYTFLGAFVNNKWKSADDTTLFTPNDDGSYTYEQEAEDGENYIHIVFAKHPYIIHSPNGGTYNNTTADTADKIDKADTYTFSETPTAGNQAQFAHWIIAGVTNEDGTPVTVGANHTVVAVVNSEDSSKYDITVKDESGNAVATIQKTDIVVLIAHYEYPQTVNVYTMINGKWELSENGGTASVSWTNMSEVNSNQTINSASHIIYVEDNTMISVSANPNDNYRLVRMVSGDTVTTEKTYIYNADGPRTTSVYYMEGNRKPIVSYVDEKNTEDSPSYVWDTYLGDFDEHKKIVSDVGGIYGNTVSTAFTAFWPGDENTYTYVQWVIDLPFDTDTLLKKNSFIQDFGDVQVDETAVKTDTDAVNEHFKGAIYCCTSDNEPKQLIVNFPTIITGESSIYSTIILDGIYSPNSTALLHAVTEINANAGNVLTSENGFSIRTDEDTYRTDEDNYYITTLN